MTRYEIEQEIEKQETDLNIVEGSDEEIACFLFNADSKAELIEVIKDEISFYKSLLNPDMSEDEGMDYCILQLSQGMAVTHW